MTDLRQAAQQALEALEELDGLDTETECVTIDVGDVIAALRTALEQQAEPVHGDIRALKYRIHELEGEVMGYKRMLDVAEAPPQRKPLTDEDIEQAQREVWRSLPSDFDYTTSSWIELGIRYAEAAHDIKETP